MGKHSAIDYVDASWNPWQGCRKVSEGCRHCYMYRQKRRYGQDPTVVVRSKPATFQAPLKWKEPRRILACSWSDFFIEEADEWRDEAWDVIRRCPRHTFLVLTKRIQRAAEHLPEDWPLPNVWLGVSVEDQASADLRIPLLLMLGAVKTFVSCEPLLGPLDLRFVRYDGMVDINVLNGDHGVWRPLSGRSDKKLDWVIVGGETGRQARPMQMAWALSLRDQCREADTPFFFKQWGEWAPYRQPALQDGPDEVVMKRVGRKQAGRLLAGRTWDEIPE